jgi:ABC-2 type transport system ATP-binding protein
MTVTTVEELIQHLERLQARAPIPIDVKRGEIFCILCPQGTSKSTLVSVMLTMLIPVPGFAEKSPFAILGNLGDLRRYMGIILQESVLNAAMTARDNLVFHACLHGLKESIRERRIREVLGQVELAESADVPVEAFSPAMVRRLEIARSFLVHPRILFIAEPTDGLNEFDRQGLWELLERLNRQRGLTIIFTTHHLAEADAIADRIAVMDGREFVALDTPDTFHAMLYTEETPLDLGDSL